MLADKRQDRRHVRVLERVEADELGVAARREGTVAVDHVGNPAAHPRREVAAGWAEHNDRAARHVFAAVVADTLHHCGCTGVAHREALAREAAEERLAGRCPVEHRVPDDDALLGDEAGAVGWPDGHRPAGETLADVVVRVADERQLDAGGEPGAETLPGRAGEADADRALRQPLPAMRLGDVVREEPADGAIDVADRERHLDRLASLERGRRSLDQLPVERVGERRILGAQAPHRRTLRNVRAGEKP